MEFHTAWNRSFHRSDRSLDRTSESDELGHHIFERIMGNIRKRAVRTVSHCASVNFRIRRTAVYCRVYPKRPRRSESDLQTFSGIRKVSRKVHRKVPRKVYREVDIPACLQDGPKTTCRPFDGKTDQDI